MSYIRSICLSAAICGLTAGAAAAQSHGFQIKAREGLMATAALNLGVLGSMAKGEAPYDATAAQDAADNLVAVSMVKQNMVLWPEGSDNGADPVTRAAPEIWSDFSGFQQKWTDFGTAAAGLQTVAANGQEALGPAMGPLGAACGACHKAYRGPER